MQEHRRPAGVDPTVIVPPASLDAEARTIGRRVAAKGVALGWIRNDETADAIAKVVEAEIRSTHGTPPDGVVDLRLGYGEAVTLATAIVEADHETRSATERDILADLRKKIFEALGLL